MIYVVTPYFARFQVYCREKGFRTPKRDAMWALSTGLHGRLFKPGDEIHILSGSEDDERCKVAFQELRQMEIISAYSIPTIYVNDDPAPVHDVDALEQWLAR